MTTALEVGEWSAARSGRTLPQGKTRYPLYRMLGGPQGRSGRAEILAPPGFDPQTVQPVAQSLYRLSYPAHRMPNVTSQNYQQKQATLEKLGWRDSCADASNFVKLEFLNYFPFKIHSAAACVGFEIDVFLDFRISFQSQNVSLKPGTTSPTSPKNDLLTKAVNHITR